MYITEPENAYCLTEMSIEANMTEYCFHI